MAGPHYTSDELKKIEHLLSIGVRPGVIAERLGRSTGSIYQAVCKYVRPNRTIELRYAEKLELRRQRVIKAFEAGLTVLEMARAFGVSHPAICQMLDRAGIDSDTRKGKDE